MPIFACALRDLAARECCCSAKCWQRQASTQALKYRGCLLMVLRCAPALRTATCACRTRRLIRRLFLSPNVLVAMNEPSLRKFDLSVQPGGWIIYNGDAFPADCERNDVNVLALPFHPAADELGDARVTNMVMLGSLLEITGALPQASIDAALHRLVKSPRWYRAGRARSRTRPRTVPGIAKGGSGMKADADPEL